MTNIEAAIAVKRDFHARYNYEPWYGYSELRMTDAGYTILVYVTSLAKAEAILPKIFQNVPIQATTMRM